MPHLVMAVFQDQDEALAAVDALVREGVAPSSVGFLAGTPERFAQLPTSVGPRASRNGKAPDPPPGFALRNLVRFVVPDFGPLLVGGPLAEAVRASPDWPAERAILDCMVRRGIDSAAARDAIEELRHGAVVVTVHDADRHRADLILRRYGPVALTS